MPAMTDHESNTLVKVLVPSDSGTGKSGALAPLIDAGYNVRVLDFDNGLSVLKGFVKDRSKLANVHYVTLRDDFSLMAGRVGIKKASAFQRAMDILDKGGDLWGVGSNIPPLIEWTPRDILVVDTLSGAGRASLWMVMQANGAAFKSPEIQHYGTAMDNIDKLLDMITSDAVGCNVIVNTHITNIEGSTRLYPEALGSKLPPKVATKFDNMISLSVNTGGKRTFKTQKDGLFALKTAVPIKETYPIETGWVEIFQDLTGKKIEELLAL